MKIYIPEGNHYEYFGPTNCHVGMACSSCRFGRYSTAESNKDQTLAWRTLSNVCKKPWQRSLDQFFKILSLTFWWGWCSLRWTLPTPGSLQNLCSISPMNSLLFSDWIMLGDSSLMKKGFKECSLVDLVFNPFTTRGLHAWFPVVPRGNLGIHPNKRVEIKTYMLSRFWDPYSVY